MAEVETQTAPEIKNTAETSKPKIASAGRPEAVSTQNNAPKIVPNNDTKVVLNNDTILGKEAANATPQANKDAAPEEKSVASAPQSELTEEQLTAYFKSQGISYEGIDKLKEKINYHPPVELTEEEKTKQSLAKEKKLVDLFIKGGGTVEQYVAIKNIADADVSELSKNSLKAELKAAGFTQDQIDEYIKDSFFQVADEELEQYEDETEKEFLKRKKEFASKLLSNYSSHTKAQAQKALADLKQAAESEDLQASQEVAISAKIDEDFKALPRKLSFEIGESNGKAISPIEYEVSESDLAEVKDMLKDPAKRNNLLFNQDGSLNTTKLTNILTRNKYLESLVKTVYHESGSRQAAIFHTVFPARSAQELGVGGSTIRTGSQKGKVVSAGRVERV
jgi:hypothetical protein